MGTSATFVLEFYLRSKVMAAKKYWMVVCLQYLANVTFMPASMNSIQIIEKVSIVT